jgi:hypothetical protein
MEGLAVAMRAGRAVADWVSKLNFIGAPAARADAELLACRAFAGLPAEIAVAGAPRP